MKIAQINNTSGIASIIAKELKKHGHEVDIFVFNKIIHSQFGGIMINYKSPFARWNLFKKLKEYEVWHYHYPYGSLKRSLEKRNKDKPYLKHYHGGDLRGRYDDDFCLVSTPDLLQYSPNGKWLPTPIDIAEMNDKVYSSSQINDGTLEKGGQVRIAHYPYYKNFPSTDYYTNTLLELGSEKKCEVVEILRLPHAQALQAVNSCDIVIGKILPDVGWFGKFELEGMALGKPVIAHVSDKLYEEYNPPIYRTTKESFKHDLEKLLEDTSERQRLGKEGLAYVRKFHSVQSVIKIVQESYNLLNS
jgi:glycosyltransferase involved in cell wall biosynthesis